MQSLSRMHPLRGQCHMQVGFYFCVTEQSMTETACRTQLVTGVSFLEVVDAVFR